ncbi:MAG: hypothetical protein RJA70_1500 [Pseudomonadota bacterium]|jgi:hypothetical protein
MLNTLFSRDTRHVWILLGLLAVGGIVFKVAKGAAVPETFGDTGPYRAAVLDELKAKRDPLIPADRVCLDCHKDVGEDRMEALHKTVRCIHCHGLGTEHVVQAKKAKDDPSIKIAKAVAWDLDFNTKQDLYNTTHKKACLVCHETIVGMPKDFAQISVKAHLEENEPDDAKSPAVCAECHDGHDTAP